MSGIQKINNFSTYVNPKTTGYAALGGMCLTGISAAFRKNPFKKQHKYLGYITIGLAFLHLGTILSHRRSKMVKNA